MQRHIFQQPLPRGLLPEWSVPLWSRAYGAGAHSVGGKFQGFRGHEDGDSSGWFTITSEWQYWTKMLFAKQGVKLAIAPTAALPALEADIRAAEGTD